VLLGGLLPAVDPHRRQVPNLGLDASAAEDFSPEALHAIPYLIGHEESAGVERIVNAAKNVLADLNRHGGEGNPGQDHVRGGKLVAVERSADVGGAAVVHDEARVVDPPEQLDEARVDLDGEEARVYSLIANRVYASQDTILFQDGQSLPHLYTMSIYPTVIGGFPNYFLEMDLKQAGDFLRGLRDVQSLADWNRLRDRYGILRNDVRFWATYDWLTQWNVKNRGQEAGYLDLSYYDLFDSVY